MLDVRKPGRPSKGGQAVPVAQALILATINQVAENGIQSVSARAVCNEAGVMFAAVNYNFGTWHGLLAASTSAVYEDYVEEIWAAANDGKQNPVDRLRNFVTAQWMWAQRMPGWSAVLNYPIASQEVYDIYTANYPDVAIKLFQLNQGRLAQLIDDVRTGKVSAFEYTPDDYPMQEKLKDTELLQLVASVGWAVLGASVWASRGEIGRRQTTAAVPANQKLLERHLDAIIAGIK